MRAPILVGQSLSAESERLRCSKDSNTGLDALIYGMGFVSRLGHRTDQLLRSKLNEQESRLHTSMVHALMD